MPKPLLGHPIENFDWKVNISQHFGCSPGVYGSRFGLPGHNGLDIIQASDKLGYGTRILAAHDFQSSSLSSDFPTKTTGNGITIKTLLDPVIKVNGIDARYMETIYWHLSDFSILAGASGKRGDIIGLMGNTGFVSPKPSNACALCPYYGTHLHFGVRFYDVFGNVIDASNGYGGYKDPVPYMFKTGDKFRMFFGSNITYASSGDEVSWLQTLLRLEGFAADYDPIAYAGSKTIRDVMKLQEKYGLNSFPVTGPKTRAILNNKYT